MTFGMTYPVLHGYIREMHLPPLLSAITTHKKKGFSLIEAAIVLGVVGLVIGGIWVAANAVSESQKNNILATGIVKIIDGTTALFEKQDFSVNTSVTSTVIAANVIPGDLVANGAATTPWGSPFVVQMMGGNTLIEIYLYGKGLRPLDGLNTAQCNELLANLAKLSFYRAASRYNSTFVDGAGVPDLSLAAPYKPSSVNCPSLFNNIQIYFNRY